MNNQTYRSSLDQLYRSSQVSFRQKEDELSDMISRMTSLFPQDQLRDDGDNMALQREMNYMDQQYRESEELRTRIDEVTRDSDLREQRNLRLRMKMERMIEDCLNDRINQATAHQKDMIRMNKKNNELYVGVLEAIDVINCTQADSAQMRTQQRTINGLEGVLDLRMREIYDLERENDQLKQLLKEKQERIDQLNTMNSQLNVMYEHEIDRQRRKSSSKNI